MAALFQISEPGDSHVKEACATAAVGIDLGTTNSLLAIVLGDEKPRALPVDEGSNLLPSVVHYGAGGGPGSVVVGRAARRLAAEFPQDTIVSVKRFMGRSAADPETLRLSPYKFAEGDAGVVRFVVDGTRTVNPVEVSAEILRALRSRAEERLGIKVQQAVITVPAYFDDAQRQATKEAGRLAGLEVLRLLNEPTAAALAYGLDKQSQGRFAVYDLGGGTFDISILQLQDGVFEVKAVGGDSALGGDDFDRALAERLLGTGPRTAQAVRVAIDAAKAAKEQLTTAESVQALGQTVTRAELEAAIRPLIEKTGNACRRALRDAGITGANGRPAVALDGVILVGGSTRVPAVRRFVREVFGLEPLADIDPDEVVALGAAVQANLLTAETPQHDVLLLDVAPLSLGLETMGGLVEKLILRNTTIPANATQEFTTFADGQNGMDIHVLQGERELVQDCRSLARFTLGGIPALPAGLARVAVTFQVDADGILSVTAKEQLTGVSQSITVKPSHGLTDEEIERMLLSSIEHAEEDIQARLLIDNRVEAQRILKAVEQQMDANGDLLSADERAQIEATVAGVREAAAGTDHHFIHQQIERLDKVSAEFAKRVMDRGIERALKGHTVGEFDQGEMSAHAQKAYSALEPEAD